MFKPLAPVAELADAQDLGSCVRTDVWVQVPPGAQHKARPRFSTAGFAVSWARRKMVACEPGCDVQTGHDLEAILRRSEPSKLSNHRQKFCVVVWAKHQKQASEVPPTTCFRSCRGPCFTMNDHQQKLNCSAKPDPGLQLKLHNVSFAFGKNEVLKPSSAAIGPGLVLVMAPNGAGKSTLLRLIAGVLKPKTGEITPQDRKVSYCGHASPQDGRIRAKDNLRYWHSFGANSLAPDLNELFLCQISLRADQVN